MIIDTQCPSAFSGKGKICLSFFKSHNCRSTSQNTSLGHIRFSELSTNANLNNITCHYCLVLVQSRSVPTDPRLGRLVLPRFCSQNRHRLSLSSWGCSWTCLIPGRHVLCTLTADCRKGLDFAVLVSPPVQVHDSPNYALSKYASTAITVLDSSGITSASTNLSVM